MNAKDRMPIHVWVANKAGAIQSTADISRLYYFCDMVRIDEGHDEIIAAIDQAIGSLPGLAGTADTLKQVIIDQKAKAAQHAAQKPAEQPASGRVTDAEEFALLKLKHEVLELLVALRPPERGVARLDMTTFGHKIKQLVGARNAREVAQVLASAI